MARKGENIRKRKDGRWEGRYLVVSQEGRKYHSVYAHSYREVKRKLLEKKAECSTASQEQVMAITVEMVANDWMETLSDTFKASTCAKYQSIYYKQIQPILGKSYMHLLTTENVRSKIMQLSPSLQRSVYSVLNHIYAYGAQKYHLNERYFSRTATRNGARSISILDTSEQARLLAYLYQDTDVYKLGIYICLATGLRLGEVCALKWSDIDWNLRLLHVNQTVQRLPDTQGPAKTHLVETAPKSFYSKREIPLSDELYLLLKKFQTNEIYVLNGNRPMEPRTLQYRFDKYLQAANITKTNFHTLRHTFATNCIQTGADIKSVSEVLGHSDVKITLNRYVHPSMDTKRTYLNNLSSIYGQISGQQIS